MRMVNEVKGEECQISPMDGFLCMINHRNLPTAVCWLPTHNVKIKKTGRDSFFDHVMINAANGDEEILVCGPS